MGAGTAGSSQALELSGRLPRAHCVLEHGRRRMGQCACVRGRDGEPGMDDEESKTGEKKTRWCDFKIRL